MHLHSKCFAAILACTALLASCDITEKRVEPAPSGRLAVGDSVTTEIPGSNSDTASVLWEFHADSGRSYLIRWTGSGSSAAANIFSSTGIRQYVELRGPSGGWDAVACFPATRSSTYRLGVTGFGRTRISVKLDDSSGIGSWVARPDRWEYDNERSAASWIAADSSWQTRSLSTSGSPDVDWMAVQVDSGRTYTVTKVDSSLGAANLQLFTTDSVAVSGNNFMSYHKGSFLVRVAATSGRGGFYRIMAASTGGYLKRDIPKDDYESDNTFLTAKALVPDDSWQSRTAHWGLRNSDLDLIRLEADSGMTCIVRIRNSDSTSPYVRGRILGPDSVERPSRADFANGTWTIEAPITKRGPVYLEIGSDYLCEAYAVSMKATKGLPSWASISNEAPRAFGSASPLPLDSMPRVFKLLGYDTNWIKIPVDSGFSYKIEFDETEGMSNTIRTSHFQIFDTLNVPSGDVLENENYYSPPASATFDSWRKGFRYLRLAPGGITPNTAIVFAVRASRKPIPADAFEPDNSMATATPLKTDSKAIHRSITGIDRDWIRIDLDSGAHSSIVLEGPSDLGWNLYSRDSLPMTATAVKLGDGRTIIDQTPLRSGPVFLLVSTTSLIPRAYSILAESATSTDTGCLSSDSPCTIPAEGGSIWTTLRSRTTQYHTLPAKAGNTYLFHAEIRTSSVFGLIDSTGIEQSPSTAKTISTSQNIVYHATADGTLRYWMKLPDYLGGYREPLRAWWTVVPDDISEPGDSTFSGALDLPSGGSRSGALTPGDRDAVKFHVDSGTSFSLATKADDTLSIKIFSPDSVMQKSVTGPPTSSPALRWDAKTSGTWYAVLSGAGALNRWTLSLDTASALGFGRDTTLSSAQTLAADGTSLSGRILGKDVGWVAVAMDSGALYEIGIESPDLFLAKLFTADSIALPTNQTQPILPPTVGSPVGKVRLRQSGKLFIRIEGIRTGTLTPTEYKIRASKTNP